MSKQTNTIRHEIIEANNIVRDKCDDEIIAIGQWYWYPLEDKNNTEWMGCVTRVGSNYVKLSGPNNDGNDNSFYESSYVFRVRMDDFSKLRREFDPEKIINNQVIEYQQKANKFLDEIKEISMKLGLQHTKKIGSSSIESNSLVAINSTTNIDKYKADLKEAKDTLLPSLFNKVKQANRGVVHWLKAASLPMQAMSDEMRKSLNNIDDRIMNVGLYAGLTEEVVSCCGGNPAEMGEKLRVVQRMLFMDEECLLQYRHGGFDFRNINEFDAWISEPENRDRVMPFNRCIVAMRVRREQKERDWDGSLSGLVSKIQLNISDRFTFLYIRNGERVYRLSCDLIFDELIFPDKSVFDPSVTMMAEISDDGHVEKMITKDEFDYLCEGKRIANEKFNQWAIDNPFQYESGDENYQHFQWVMSNPFRAEVEVFRDFSENKYHPFNITSVYYDDILAFMSDEIKKYNRIAVIIQGLFDRSDVLHPHPPVKTWTNDGFFEAIDLIYDGTRALTDGDKPDIDAYIKKCNQTLNKGSVVIGQELFWCKKEAEKECRRLDSDYRNRSEYRPKTFFPEGNPGPGYIARIDEWKPRSRVASFTWYRSSRSSRYEERYSINSKISVPDTELFNVSEYTPGDFKQFFQDPRTRAEYLRWAPMLIAAEEYHAGNLFVQEPICNDD